MELDYEKDDNALVGVAFNKTVIYNIVERDGEFGNTGMSIINFLKTDKNKFMSEIIASQSYESIKLIFDDHIILGELYDKSNTNVEDFSEIYNFMKSETDYEIFYIFDLLNDVLIIKIPELPSVHAIDYKKSSDVRDFINKIKKEGDKWVDLNNS
jgi:hypothetical protein